MWLLTYLGKEVSGVNVVKLARLCWCHSGGGLRCYYYYYYFFNILIKKYKFLTTTVVAQNAWIQCRVSLNCHNVSIF